MNTTQNKIKGSVNQNIQRLMSNEELNWPLVYSHSVLHNDQKVTLLRFEPNGHLKWLSSNTSILLNKDQLQGMSRLLPQYNDKLQQVSVSDAENIMVNFISTYAPDLKSNYKLQWIKAHDEKIVVNGESLTVRGMKVKCRDLNTGLYFWTIVAPDSSILIFERDIEWDFIKAGRQTQKWLHDEWAMKKIEL